MQGTYLNFKKANRLGVVPDVWLAHGDEAPQQRERRRPQALGARQALVYDQVYALEEHGVVGVGLVPPDVSAARVCGKNPVEHRVQGRGLHLVLRGGVVPWRQAQVHTEVTATRHAQGLGVFVQFFGGSSTY